MPLGPAADAVADHGVGLGGAVLGDVAGHDDETDARDGVDACQDALERGRGVDGSLVQGAVTGQVGVGEVEDAEGPRCGRLHGPTVSMAGLRGLATSAPVRTVQPSSAGARFGIWCETTGSHQPVNLAPSGEARTVRP